MFNTYEELLDHVRRVGNVKTDRTGTGTLSYFGAQLRYDLSKGFPLITTKKVNFKAIVGELLWFLRGETNVKSLQADGIKIWDAWADEDGELGPIYGSQWRSWYDAEFDEEIDQIAEVIETLKTDPDSRRMIVSAWNVAEIEDMALPPCHTMFQFYVNDGKLSCQLYQRSGDLFLGVPFNIASYALLTHIIAREVGLEVGEFIWTGGDCHIYQNHLVQVDSQLARTPHAFPTISFNQASSLEAYTISDFKLSGYRHHPAIKAPVAV